MIVCPGLRNGMRFFRGRGDLGDFIGFAVERLRQTENIRNGHHHQFCAAVKAALAASDGPFFFLRQGEVKKGPGIGGGRDGAVFHFGIAQNQREMADMRFRRTARRIGPQGLADPGFIERAPSLGMTGFEIDDAHGVSLGIVAASRKPVAQGGQLWSTPSTPTCRRPSSR